MPQSISVVRGTTSLAPTTGAFSTILTVPSCISCRVVIVGLAVYKGAANSTSYRFSLVHTTSTNRASPITYWNASGTVSGAYGMIPIDGGPNSTYVGQQSPAGTFISNSGGTSFISTSSGTIGLVSTNGITGNNIKNLWMGPGDTIRAGVWQSDGGSASLNYNFILIAET